MKLKRIFVLAALFAAVSCGLSAQSQFLQKVKLLSGDSISLNMSEVRYASASGSGAMLAYGSPMTPYYTSSSLADIVSASCGNLVQFTQYETAGGTSVVGINPKWVKSVSGVSGASKAILYMYGSQPDKRTVSGSFAYVSGLLGACVSGGGGGGSGTVTSVALTAPAAVFDVTGSPVTTSGTLALAFDNQSANTLFSGPATGAAAAPTFRAMVTADIPDAGVTMAKIAQAGASSGQVIKWNGSAWAPAADDNTAAVNLYNSDGALTANRTVTGGSFSLSYTGLTAHSESGSGDNSRTTTGTADILDTPADDYVVTAGGGLSVTWNGAAEDAVVTDGSTTKRGLEYAADYSGTLIATARSLPDVGTVRGIYTAGTGIGIALVGNNMVVTNTGDTNAGDDGTVTSVALTAPTAVFDVAGSPVTNSGTLALSFDNQAANTLFAGPSSGGAAAPAFRAMVTADIPDAAVTMAKIAQAGATSGQVISWNGTAWAPATVASAVNIYNTDGTLTGNRTLTGGSFNLTITGVGAYDVSSSGAQTYTAAGSSAMSFTAGGAYTVDATDDVALSSADASFTASCDLAMSLSSTSGNIIVSTGAPGALTINDVSSSNNTVKTAATETTNSTGAPANGFGRKTVYKLESNTTDGQDAASLGVLWSDATHATRTADIVFENVTSSAALAETFRIGGTTQALTATALVSNTTSVADRLIVKTNSSGTAGNGFGSGILFQAESSTTNNRDQARFSTYWTTSDDATREGAFSWQLEDNGTGGLVEVMKLDRTITSGKLSIGNSNAVTIANTVMTLGTTYIIGNSSNTLTLNSSSTSGGLTFTSSGAHTGGTAGIIVGTVGYTSNTLSKTAMRFTDTYTPTGGTGTFKYLEFAGTINQSSGGTGATHGIYLNNTLTSPSNYYSIESTNGRMKFTDTQSSGSGSLSGTLLDLAQTWNTSASPTAVKLNVTNTSSGSSALLLDLQVGGTSKMSVDKSGNLTANNVLSGTYTPTVTNSTNTDAAVTVTQAQYCRVGNVVTVSGRFTADPTTATNATSFEMSLPIASNLGAAEDCAGTANCGTISGMSAAVTALSANDTARVGWIASDVTSQTWSFVYTYEVIP